MSSYSLAPEAARDLELVLEQGVELFGLDQTRRYRDGLSETFAFIASYPRAARLREEIEPPIRVHRYQSHLILYDLVDDGSVIIQRIRHGREDWQADIGSH